MDLHVLEELDVVGGARELDPKGRLRFRETARLLEPPLLLDVDDERSVGVGGQRPRRTELGDLRIDLLDAVASSERDAMVAVDHEVGVPQLVDHDRRERIVREGPGDATHPIRDVAAARREPAVEVARPSLRSDDLLDRDGTNPGEVAGERLHAPDHLLELEEIG
ncbi:MAG TPA: hypothetical protein VLA82_07285 [Actinomycetota bacterium]|nr:hypothetical protein [Actinomycetota bacterium]